jgi:hypothetical protein
MRHPKAPHDATMLELYRARDVTALETIPSSQSAVCLLTRKKPMQGWSQGASKSCPWFSKKTSVDVSCLHLDVRSERGVEHIGDNNEDRSVGGH